MAVISMKQLLEAGVHFGHQMIDDLLNSIASASHNPCIATFNTNSHNFKIGRAHV